MQRIQYTQKQIEQLLEMCKVLFPEYKNYHVNGAFLYLNKGGIPLDAIPIFEFCMTYLAQEVLGKQIPRSIMERYPIFALESFMHTLKSVEHYQHPVDYLYQEFLKLK